ncbi:MAG: acyl-[acyl-carrier-protein] thioesterase [Ilumatobacteraceae bacterium]
MTAPAAVELLDPLPGGRRFDAERTVRLGDVDPDGLLRSDAVGRYLQDVASDDAVDAGLDNALGWVVRRTLIRVERPAVAGETVRLTTYCTGSGRSWAERRTRIRSEAGAHIDAVSLWVQLDVSTCRPARLGAGFFDVYGASAGGRQVSARLSLPGIPPVTDGRSMPWRFRRSDLDQFGHVNNAAQLAVVEEHRIHVERTGDLEVEYLAPVASGADLLVVTDGGLDVRTSWMLDTDGLVSTVFRWRRAGQTQPSSSEIGRS